MTVFVPLVGALRSWQGQVVLTLQHRFLIDITNEQLRGHVRVSSWG